jgi:predicted transposase/invertase (TIGR01784 family)
MIMKQVEERYISFEASKMAYRDIKNFVDTAKREGIAEGKEIGMKEGMEKGMEKGREEGRAEGMNLRSLEIARKMLAKGMDEASIMDMTGLTAEEIKLLKAEM